MKWVKEFNQFDLYSKVDQLPDLDKLRPYYQSLVDKYCRGKLKWWSNQKSVFLNLWSFFFYLFLVLSVLVYISFELMIQWCDSFISLVESVGIPKWEASLQLYSRPGEMWG